MVSWHSSPESANDSRDKGAYRLSQERLQKFTIAPASQAK